MWKNPNQKTKILDDYYYYYVILFHLQKEDITSFATSVCSYILMEGEAGVQPDSRELTKLVLKFMQYKELHLAISSMSLIIVMSHSPKQYHF